MRASENGNRHDGSVAFVKGEASISLGSARRRSTPPPLRRPLSPRGQNKAPAAEPLTSARSSTPTKPPVPHAAERINALTASRADAYKGEVEELRASIARMKQQQRQQEEDHAASMRLLHAELEARSRGEGLARARCEAAEVELRAARQLGNKMRESLTTRSDALGTELMEKCKVAMRSLAKRGLAASVLAWRRRALRFGVSQWSASCRTMMAEEIEREALTIVQQAQGYARAELENGIGEDTSLAEARADELRSTSRVRRLRHYFAAQDRSFVVAALSKWRLAAHAHVSMDDMHEMSSRLRHAQAAIGEVVDGKTALENQQKRHAAFARVLLGRVGVHAMRKDKRERFWSLMLGFRPWVLLALSDHLNGVTAVKERLAVSKESEDHSTRRANELRNALHVARNNLAAVTKRSRDAEKIATEATEQAAKANEQRERCEAQAKVDRARADALEREKYQLMSSVKRERQASVAVRKYALRSFLMHRACLLLARALHSWAAAGAAIQSERTAALAQHGREAWPNANHAGVVDVDVDMDAETERYEVADSHSYSHNYYEAAATPAVVTEELEWARVDLLPVDPASVPRHQRGVHAHDGQGQRRVHAASPNPSAVRRPIPGPRR